MTDGGDVVLGAAPPREKMFLRVFSRSLGMIGSHTFETQEEILPKLFPDQSTVVHYTGVDEIDQVVEHWFEIAGKGDIGLVVIVPLKDRKVLPITGMPQIPPNSGPGHRR